MLRKLSIFSAAVILMVILFNSIIMPWYVKHAIIVKVPNITGLKYNDAQKLLVENGLDAKQGDVRYDESKPVGLVLDQNPPYDQMVKKGRRIYLTVCGGEQLIEVPRLIGKTTRDAKFGLEQRNLQVGEILHKFTSEYPEDFVISQVIQPGSKVKKSTKIDLIVSNGQQLGDIIIPDLMGKKLDDVKKLLEEKKLKTGKVTYQPSDNTPGTVVDQYPRKDKSAKENTPIDIFIAKKRKPEDKKVGDEVIDDVKFDKKPGNSDKSKPDNKSKDSPKDNTDKPKEKEKTKDTKSDKSKDTKQDSPRDNTDKSKDKNQKGNK